MEGEKFKAVCADCNEECEIPFNPTEGRPVKCDACFRRGRDRNRGNGGFGGDRPRRDFDVVCADCGKDTTVPFKPTQGKPVLCRECFKGK
jgi:CxxC-x17-CxxC domain-containing protein